MCMLTILITNTGVNMRKTVISLFIIITMVSFAFADGFRQVGVAPPFDPSTMYLGDPTNAGRSVLAGTDLDQDGKYEVWITSYWEHKVYCYEQVGNDTLALVWVSADVTTALHKYSPRDIKSGDLDGDGNGELIFFVGEELAADRSSEGLQIYEWDGVTDNGFGEAPALTVNFFSGLNDTLTFLLIDNFSVGDIDDDGKEEILIANNGPDSGTALGSKDGSTPYSQDRFIILSIIGNIGDFGTTAVEEYSVSPRDANQDGTRGNSLGGGSPLDIVICDTDGDGLKEAACFSYNNLAVFFIEATGPDSYTTALGKKKAAGEPFVKLSSQDDWTLGASVADMDSDGKDEVYVVGYDDATLFVIKDIDGDATSIDATTEVGIIGTGVVHACTATPGFGIVVGGGEAAADIFRFELASGGSVLKTNTNNSSVTGDWNMTSHTISDATTGWIQKISDAQDWDNDGNWEFVLPYKGVLDKNAAGNGFDPVQNRVFRIVEWDENYVGIKDITFIMPDDFQLAQNYPNPFNPTTTISYTLPIQSTITVNIYNFLGEKVATLIENEVQTSGVHNVQWNSLDINGNRVPNGVYFYELKYGNFSKTKRMTLLK